MIVRVALNSYCVPGGIQFEGVRVQNHPEGKQRHDRAVTKVHNITEKRKGNVMIVYGAVGGGGHCQRNTDQSLEATQRAVIPDKASLRGAGSKAYLG